MSVSFSSTDLFHAVGSFVLDIGDHLRSPSDISDNDECDNWQDNDALVVITLMSLFTYIIAANNACRQ